MALHSTTSSAAVFHQKLGEAAFRRQSSVSVLTALTFIFLIPNVFS